MSSMSTKGDGTRVPSPESRVPDEVNLLDYWRVFWKYRKMIVAIVGAASIAAVIISLVLPKIYKAEALIVPVSAKGGGGLSALASQFGGLASLAGISLPTGGGAEKFMAILKSRTLTENVINRENLMPILFKSKWDKKAGRWKGNDPKREPTVEEAVFSMRSSHMKFFDDKKNKTIKISGLFRDPNLAARVVNAYVGELQNFINANAFTMAKRNRMFVEGQLEQNKRDLLEAGKEISEFYKGKRISNTEAAVDVPLNSQAALAQLNSSDMSVVKRSNPGNPHSVTVPELEVLLAEKAELNKKIAGAKVVKNVPQQVYLTYLMMRRELLGRVNALLTTQYEMAKIEEAKEDLAFEVIDYAVPPIKRYSPKRRQICMMSFFAALFVSVFLAFFREYLRKMKEVNP